MRNRFKKQRPLFSSPLHARQEIEWKILPILWLALRRTCTAIGAFVLLIILMLFYSASTITTPAPPSLPKEMVLFLPLEGDLPEIPDDSAFSDPFAFRQQTMLELVDAIDAAAVDDRVKGIYARMGSGSLSLVHIQELRSALKRFRATGKFAYIYSPSYGEGAGDLGRYYLASAFDEIWMQPLGIVSIGGLRAEVPFFRGVLDKIGVNPQFYKRKEYKTAYESLTNSRMSDPNRRAMQDLVSGIRTEILKDIPADTGKTPAEFEKLVDKGLFTAPEALTAKLITHSSYADVLVERIKKDITGDPESEDDLFVDVGDYDHARQRELSEHRLIGETFARKRPAVALIYASGLIVDSRVGAQAGVMAEDGIAAADEIAPALLDAADDENIGAVVIRIDSPGGSPVASETILRAVERVKKKGKPVIVSMGPVAASGGYWIAAGADYIFAMPTTLTGSIGVLGGKFSGEELWKKLGVHWDNSIHWGENSGLWSINTPFSATEAERINAMLDEVYKSFLQRVATGRNMSVEQVDKIAGGRVWSGREAVSVGLADKNGGLDEALDYTAGLLGAANRTALDIVVLPEPRTPFEKLMDFLGEHGQVYVSLKFQGRVMEYFKPALEMLAVMNGAPAAYEPLRIE